MFGFGKKINESKDHLTETGWSYREHLVHSVKQSNRLIIIAFKSYVHGIFPWMYKSDGPLAVYKIYKEISKIRHIQKIFKKHIK